MKRFKMAHGLIGVDKQPVKTPVRIVEATALTPGKVEEWGETTADIFLFVLSNAPLQSQSDSIQGARLYEAAVAAKDAKAEYLEVEDGTHDWLKPVAEKLTPSLYRINGNIVYKFILEGFEKPHEPKETKAENKK